MSNLEICYFVASNFNSSDTSLSESCRENRVQRGAMNLVWMLS